MSALAAAARLVPFVALAQVSKLLGCPVSVLKERPVEYVTADAIHVIGFRWAAGTINGGRVDLKFELNLPHNLTTSTP